MTAISFISCETEKKKCQELITEEYTNFDSIKLLEVRSFLSVVIVSQSLSLSLSPSPSLSLHFFNTCWEQKLSQPGAKPFMTKAKGQPRSWINAASWNGIPWTTWVQEHRQRITKSTFRTSICPWSIAYIAGYRFRPENAAFLHRLFNLS